MTSRKALVFTLQVLPLWSVLLLVYPLALSLYEPVVLAAANAGLERLDPPARAETDETGNRVVYGLAENGKDRPLFTVQGRARRLLYSNLFILPALVLATPTAWARRFRLLGWAAILLVTGHVLAEIGWVHAFLCLERDPANGLCRAMSVNLEIGGPLFAVVQWALVTWRVWIPAPAERLATPSTG